MYMQNLWIISYRFIPTFKIEIKIYKNGGIGLFQQRKNVNFFPKGRDRFISHNKVKL